jgi:hypothetical protein
MIMRTDSICTSLSLNDFKLLAPTAGWAAIRQWAARVRSYARRAKNYPHAMQLYHLYACRLCL